MKQPGFWNKCVFKNITITCSKSISNRIESRATRNIKLAMHTASEMIYPGLSRSTYQKLIISCNDRRLVAIRRSSDLFEIVFISRTVIPNTYLLISNKPNAYIRCINSPSIKCDVHKIRYIGFGKSPKNKNDLGRVFG